MDKNRKEKDEFSNPFDKDTQFESVSAIDDGGMRPIEDENSGRTFVWLLVGIAAIGCGILFAVAFIFFKPDAQALVDKYFPSPTPTFTRTPTITPTQTLTPTITPSPTQTSTPTPNLTATAKIQRVTNTAIAFESTATNVVASWKIKQSDTFESNRKNWLTGPHDDEYTKTTYTIANGVYQWDVTAHQSSISWLRISATSVENFYFTIDVRQASGTTSADFGAVFREDDNGNYYYFGINNRQQYMFYAYNNGEWDTLIDRTRTDAIKANEFNQITIIAEESHFAFFVNGHFITEFSDERIKSGMLALAIELSVTDKSAVFEFENLELRTP